MAGPRKSGGFLHVKNSPGTSSCGLKPDTPQATIFHLLQAFFYQKNFLTMAICLDILVKLFCKSSGQQAPQA